MADCKRKTANLVPPPLTPKSETVNGLTFNVKSDGIVEISGTATESTIYSYKLKTSFTMPTSKTAGGNGYLYYWNTFTSSGTIRLRYNNQQVDYWSITPINRVINKFDNAENVTIDEIEIRIPSGETINGNVGIMVTDNGEIASAFIPYWQHSLRKYGTSTDTLTTLPAVVYADGNTATVGLKGNMSQTGTPTPSAPIQPSETGERTGNLWNESYTGIKIDVITYLPLNVGDGDYTLSSTVTVEGQAAVLFLLAGNVSSGATTANNGVWNGQSRTVTAVDGYVTIGYRKCTEANPENANTMLNTGSTAKPYEPYGYKLDIKSANTTTPVYLGEVESTRKIMKLVLTGDEDWKIEDSDNFYINDVITDAKRTKTVVCSHQVSVQSIYTTGVENTWISSSGRLNFTTTAVSHTATAFKTYLAQQYAAGTPVTIWYVLATEETSIVNEPLRKIGDYADTVSGITIPTITGKDTVDVETTLKPSEVSLAYTGWHDAYVKELNNLLVNNSLCGIRTYKDTLNLATGACTRIISKYEFTGQENWVRTNAGYFYTGNAFSDYNNTQTLYQKLSSLFSHYIATWNDTNGNSLSNGYACLYCSNSSPNNYHEVYIRDNSYSTANDFKAYLAQQYANGTPVTIWYVLAESTTETITVPSGLSGTEEGYLIQDGTPTPTNPIYPTANNVGLWQ